MALSGKVRRSVLRGLCGALAFALAPGVRAQPDGRRRVAVFHWLDRKQYAEAYPRFFSTLAEKGWKEGSNLLLEWHGIRVDDPNLDAAAAKAVATRPDAILTESTRATRAIANATRAIPIVTFVGDPVVTGFAQSLAKPGGNVTGTCACADGAPAQLIGLLRSVTPRLTSVAIVYSSKYSTAREQAKPMLAAASKSGVAARLLLVSPQEIDAVIRRAAQDGVQALVIGNLVDQDNYQRVGEAARSHKLPTVGSVAELKGSFLLTIEILPMHMDRSLATTLDKVLRGENAGQLPFVQPEGSTMVVNRRLARAIGVEIPRDMLLLASEVID